MSAQSSPENEISREELAKRAIAAAADDPERNDPDLGDPATEHDMPTVANQQVMPGGDPEHPAGTGGAGGMDFDEKK